MFKKLLQKLLGIFFTNESKSSKRFWIFILRFSILLTVIFVFIFFLTKLFGYSNVEKIDFSGNTIYFKTKDKIIYNYLFATSEFWGNPQIKFSKDDKITIRATGQYYTAIHHLVDYARTDTNRIFKWVGPEGFEDTELLRKTDKLRQSYCIDTNVNYGALLVRTHKNNSHIVSEPFFFDNKTREINLTFEYDGCLEFIVNEPILEPDDKGRDAYLVKRDEDSLYESTRPLDSQIKAWNSIVKGEKENLTHLWFDDNIGNFFITIEHKNSN